MDSQNNEGLAAGKDHVPSKAPEDAIPYCLDCYYDFGSKRPLPDGWWGERRRIRMDGRWYALCHAHFDKREREKVLESP